MGLIVNQELILKRVFPRVIVSLYAELIHSLIKDVFGQKKGTVHFSASTNTF